MLKRWVLLTVFALIGVQGLVASPICAHELLVKITRPGYVPNGYNNVVYRTVIRGDGTIVRGYKLTENAPWHEEITARLSSHALAELTQKLAELTFGELTFPKGPTYADTPSIQYLGHTRDGDVVKFIEYNVGRWGKLESFRYADDLKHLIDSY